MKTNPTNHVKYHLRKALFLLSAGIVLSSGATLLAGPITYSSYYIPNGNGSAANGTPLLAGGTVIAPSWNSGTTGGTDSATGGVLTASTMPLSTNSLFWRIGNGNPASTTYGTSSAWGVTQTTGVTVDFNMQVLSGTNAAWPVGGFQMTIAAGGFTDSVLFGTNSVYVMGSSNAILAVNTSVDNISAFVTYRVIMQNNKISLFSSASPTAIFSNIAMSSLGADTTSDYMYFGDGVSAESGSYNLSFVGWEKAADFSAPPVSPVPEPATVGLALMGLAAVMFRKRIRVADLS